MATVAEASDQRSCQAVASVAVLRSYKSTITVIGWPAV